MRDQIANLIDEVRREAPNGDQISGVIAALQARSHMLILDGRVFREHEYEIKVGPASAFAKELEALELVKPLGLTAAPEVVAVLSIDAAAPEVVFITRYKAVEGEWLDMVARARARFHPEAGEQLRDDMKALTDAGFVHPYARDVDHWIVSSESQTLFLDGWHALRRGSELERGEMLAAVDAILAERTR